MTNLLGDIAYAWRNALKRPGASLLIVSTLALGIGANGAMFSIAWRTLLAPLPYVDGERIVKIEQHMPARDRDNAVWARPTFEDLRAGSTVLTNVAGYSENTFPVTVSGEPAAAVVGVVSANFFGLFGIEPALGRDFVAADDPIGAPPVVILGQDFWRTQGADPEIVGKTIEAGGLALTVIGVLPPLPAYPDANDLWVTHAGDPYYVKLPDQSGSRESYWFDRVYGKLADGAGATELAADLDTLAQRLEMQYPDVYQEDYNFTARTLRDELAGDALTSFVLLQAMALLVLIVASVNVANLNLARVSERHQELAVREAVGANARVLGLHLMTDSLLHGIAGGALGLLLSFFGLDLLKDFAAQFTPLAADARLDSATLLFALALSLLSGTIGGLAPSFIARDLHQALKEGGSKSTAAAGSARRRRVLLVFQFSFAFVIMTSAALILLSLQRLDAQDAGYDAEGVLALSMIYLADLSLPPEDLNASVGAFAEQLQTRVSMLPGVVEAGLLGGKPLLDTTAYLPQREAVLVESGVYSANAPAFAQVRLATGNYFQAVGMPLLRGRTFDETDTRDTELVLVVNANFAARYFPQNDVIGQRVRLSWETEWWTIVGVVGNIRPDSLASDEGEIIYWNFAQRSADILNLYVKTSDADTAALGREIRKIVQDISPGQAVRSIRPLEDIRDSWLAPARLRAVLMLLAGGVALLVTLSGVVGIVACNIGMRLREVGVRAALGARPPDITRLFLGQSLLLCACGIMLGLVLMPFAGYWLEPLLYQTTTIDPAVYLASAVVLVIAVLAASWLPASRAALLAPIEALHAE
ncbi:MAG: ADOP family duplicated permease [Gammaproteobacteria bacterium]